MFTPFRGLLFDPQLVPEPGLATSPPYDVIDEDERRQLLAASPYNVVRLLLAEPGDSSYVRAAELLARWRTEAVLAPDPSPRLYLYAMQFAGDDGPQEAVGVIGALAVEDLGDRVVGHEETMAGTRADRMSVLAATRANLDPIVALSPAPALADLLVPQGPPRLDFAADGVRHRLYDVADPDRIAAIGAAVGAHPVAIADGHHRYTTAGAFREQQPGPGPWDAIMAFLAPAAGSGLRIDPVHRGFERVEGGATREVLAGFRLDTPGRPAPGDAVVHWGAEHGRAPARLRPRSTALAGLPEPWRAAGTAVARELLYGPLGVDEASAHYFSDLEAALAWLEGHPKGALVEVAPVSEEAVAAASAAGLRFPQKTTFFAPKPRAGLVLRSFTDQEGRPRPRSWRRSARR